MRVSLPADQLEAFSAQSNVRSVKPAQQAMTHAVNVSADLQAHQAIK